MISSCQIPRFSTKAQCVWNRKVIHLTDNRGLRKWAYYCILEFVFLRWKIELPVNYFLWYFWVLNRKHGLILREILFEISQIIGRLSCKHLYEPLHIFPRQSEPNRPFPLKFCFEDLQNLLLSNWCSSFPFCPNALLCIWHNSIK